MIDSIDSIMLRQKLSVVNECMLQPEYVILVIFTCLISLMDSFSGMATRPSPHVQRLVLSMLKIQNKTKGAEMKKYLKDHFPCLGIQRPARNTVQKAWLAEVKADSEVDPWDLAWELWEQEHREFQYVAIDYMKSFPKTSYKKDDHIAIERFVTTKSWWDTVDFISSHVAGNYFKKCPYMIEPVITEWRNSDNKWLNRTCLLFQLRYKKTTDFELLKGLVLQYLDVKDFFIQKAIGWSLRQYSRTNPNAVRDFITDLDLSTVAKREAMKYT